MNSQQADNSLVFMPPWIHQDDRVRLRNDAIAVEVVDHTRPIRPLVKMDVDNDSKSQIFWQMAHEATGDFFFTRHNMASKNGDDPKCW